jgi:hypothetical protein
VSVKITVLPAEFTLVQYEAAEIADVAADVADKIGFPDGTEVRVEVDEQSPLGKTEVLGIDPVTVAVESGAFEDAKRPRHLSERSVRSVLGRLLFRAHDRLDPSFAEAPPDEDLPLREHVAWDVYAVGRCERLGWRVQKERRRYHFRIRHGFTDVADAAFDRLWAADALTWADLQAVCNETEAADVRAAAVKRGRGR